MPYARYLVVRDGLATVQPRMRHGRDFCEAGFRQLRKDTTREGDQMRLSGAAQQLGWAMCSELASTVQPLGRSLHNTDVASATTQT